MSEINLRAARIADIPRLLEIQALSSQAASWSAQDYRPLVEAGQPGVLVATAGSDVIGFLACRRTARDETEVLNLAVAPESRRAGVGSKLVRELLARRQGSVFLEVRAGNLAAMGLYRKLGFRQTGRRAAYYQRPTEDAVLMSFSR